MNSCRRPRRRWGLLLRFRLILANLPKFFRSFDQRPLAALLFFNGHGLIDETLRRASRALIAKDVQRRKAEAWFCTGAFLLALGCIVAVSCILAPFACDGRTSGD